jgi:hypothetical protein
MLELDRKISEKMQAESTEEMAQRLMVDAKDITAVLLEDTDINMVELAILRNMLADTLSEAVVELALKEEIINEEDIKQAQSASQLYDLQKMGLGSEDDIMRLLQGEMSEQEQDEFMNMLTDNILSDEDFGTDGDA